MLLLKRYPQVARRDCQKCHEWLYNEKTGAIDTTQDGKPIRRPPKGIVSVPPCRQKENGCPKGTPENPKTLTRQNQKAYAHYLQCKATGQFPDDPIVKYHAGLIREVEEFIEEARHEHLEKLLEAVLTRTI